MTDIIMRSPTTEAFDRLQNIAIGMSIVAPPILNAFVISITTFFGSTILEEKTSRTPVEIAFITAAISIFATSAVSFLTSFLIVIAYEFSFASKSRQTNEPIGYIIQSSNEKYIQCLRDARNLPLIQISKFCPPETFNPRQRFMNDLEIIDDTNNPVISPYTLEDVADANKMAFMSAPWNGLFFGLSVCYSFYLMPTQPIIKGPVALFGIIYGSPFILAPIYIYFFSKLFKLDFMKKSTRRIPAAKTAGSIML